MSVVGKSGLGTASSSALACPPLQTIRQPSERKAELGLPFLTNPHSNPLLSDRTRTGKTYRAACHVRLGRASHALGVVERAAARA